MCNIENTMPVSDKKKLSGKAKKKKERGSA
jgi:hypothetical protein